MGQTTYGATRTNPGAPNAAEDLSQNSNQPQSNGGADKVWQTADQAREAVNEEAAEKRAELERQARETADAAKQKTREAAERARESGRRYAAEKKSSLADEIGVFSSAIRKASGKLHEEHHDSIANYVDAAAERLDQARDSLKSKEVSELVDDLQDFTRRRPEIVYGGLFVAGLAAMRFLKASSPHRSSESDGLDIDLSRDINRPPAAFGHTPRPTVTPPPPAAQSDTQTPQRSHRS